MAALSPLFPAPFSFDLLLLTAWPGVTGAAVSGVTCVAGVTGAAFTAACDTGVTVAVVMEDGDEFSPDGNAWQLDEFGTSVPGKELEILVP